MNPIVANNNTIVTLHLDDEECGSEQFAPHGELHGDDTSGLHRVAPHVVKHRVGVTPSFKAKPNTHSMCAQESSLHTYHTENGYRIINVTIYNIYCRIISLQKTSRTLFEAL
jgi:hypothetical protein